MAGAPAGNAVGRAPCPVVASLSWALSVLASSLSRVIFPPRISEILPLPGSPASVSLSLPLRQHFALIIAVLTSYVQMELDSIPSWPSARSLSSTTLSDRHPTVGAHPEVRGSWYPWGKPWPKGNLGAQGKSVFPSFKPWTANCEGILHIFSEGLRRNEPLCL